eukprot:11915671-Ditylum_brightwellii.AAC.1
MRLTILLLDAIDWDILSTVLEHQQLYSKWCKLSTDMPLCIPNDNVGEALCDAIDEQAEIS